jgi:hypothetical protein
MAEAEVMAAVATSAAAVISVAVDTLAEVGISAAALALAAECVSAGRASAADPRYRGLRRGQASAANAPLRATAT